MLTSCCKRRPNGSKKLPRTLREYQFARSLRGDLEALLPALLDGWSLQQAVKPRLDGGKSSQVLAVTIVKPDPTASGRSCYYDGYRDQIVHDGTDALEACQ